MVYVTGDMHGDISRFDSPAIKQLKKGDTLIVCGDFGFVWDNSKIEQKILKNSQAKNSIYASLTVLTRILKFSILFPFPSGTAERFIISEAIFTIL